jgi:aldehyde:ferredoxin oxidoreductase
LDLELAVKFVGGRGLASYFLTQEIAPEIEPLDPANKIIFATGPLTGSRAPTAGRYMVVTKSPLSGTVASSNSGGFWGAELKRAGYDLIIVEGKSDKPCYIRDGRDKGCRQVLGQAGFRNDRFAAGRDRGSKGKGFDDWSCR